MSIECSVEIDYYIWYYKGKKRKGEKRMEKHVGYTKKIRERKRKRERKRELIEKEKEKEKEKERERKRKCHERLLSLYSPEFTLEGSPCYVKTHACIHTTNEH